MTKCDPDIYCNRQSQYDKIVNIEKMLYQVRFSMCLPTLHFLDDLPIIPKSET